VKCVWSHMLIIRNLGVSFHGLLCCREVFRSSSMRPKKRSHWAKVVVSGRRSMALCRVGISHSIGRTTSIPWTRWKGVKSVVVLIVV